MSGSSTETASRRSSMSIGNSYDLTPASSFSTMELDHVLPNPVLLFFEPDRAPKGLTLRQRIKWETEWQRATKADVKRTGDYVICTGNRLVRFATYCFSYRDRDGRTINFYRPGPLRNYRGDALPLWQPGWYWPWYWPWEKSPAKGS